MTLRILKITLDDLTKGWLVPLTSSISWIEGQLVLKLSSKKTRNEIQTFLVKHEIPVIEYLDEKELIINPSKLEELSIIENNITTEEFLQLLDS